MEARGQPACFRNKPGFDECEAATEGGSSNRAAAKGPLSHAPLKGKACMVSACADAAGLDEIVESYLSALSEQFAGISGTGVSCQDSRVHPASAVTSWAAV